MTYPFTIGGVPMQFPIMLGGGVCKFVHQLDPYLRPDLPVGALEIGSFTPALREGNPGSPQWPEGYEELQRYGFGLNAWSMPNAGFPTSASALEQRILGTAQPPVIGNIAGFVPQDFIEGVKTFEALPGVAATTLNLGCPNTENVPIAYDLNSITAILDDLRLAQPEKPVWVKLSPYISKTECDRLTWLLHPLQVNMNEVPTAPQEFLEEVLSVLLEYPFVKAVILTNTLGNVQLIDPNTDKPAIEVNNGKAGLSGDFLREHITLPLVERAFAFLGEHLDIIACGGIFTGSHVLDYLEAGAKAVQCVSGPTWNGGPRFFVHLLEDPSLQYYLTERIQ